MGLSIAEGVPLWKRRAARVAFLFAAELVAVAFLYQFFADIECGLTDAQMACDALRGLVTRALVVLAVAAILIRARPGVFGAFLNSVDAHESVTARTVHLLGVGLMLVPLGMAWGGDLSAVFYGALIPWLSGAALALAGGFLWFAPRQAWRQLLWIDSPSTVPIFMAAALVPDLAYHILPIWDWQALTTATFIAVTVFLRMFSGQVESYPDEYIIGVEEFFVSIAPQCSGVEGFALVTAFVALYAFLFRKEIRLGRFLLVMLPVGIALSWILNIIRIGVLILIGARVSPEVAVNGFHSYAGWLLFTLLAFGLITVVQSSAWLHRDGLRPKGYPLRTDPMAAYILPFAAFMLTSTFIAATFLHPSLGLPLNTAVLAAMVVVFLPVYRTLPWQPDVGSLVAGFAVGVFWVFLAPEADPGLQGALAVLPLWLFIAWAAARIIGTTFLVPLVEEVFFRGYLLARLDGPQIWRRISAIAVSSMAFGLLHGRWVEAGLAGVVFAIVMFRRGRVTDAVWAHVVANSIVALTAAARGDWSLI